MVDGNAVQPGIETVLLAEAVQVAEGFGKGFDGNVLRIVFVGHHLVDGEEQLPPVAFEQGLVGLLASLQGEVHAGEVALGLG
jgi:hypothetical protein